MRGPAGVAAPDPAVERLVGQERIEVRELALGPPDFEAVLAQDVEPGRVKAAVFELAQPVDEDLLRITESNVANDSPHDASPPWLPEGSPMPSAREQEPRLPDTSQSHARVLQRRRRSAHSR